MKLEYIKPEIEEIQLELEGAFLNVTTNGNGGVGGGIDDNPYEGDFDD